MLSAFLRSSSGDYIFSGSINSWDFPLAPFGYNFRIKFASWGFEITVASHKKARKIKVCGFSRFSFDSSMWSDSQELKWAPLISMFASSQLESSIDEVIWWHRHVSCDWLKILHRRCRFCSCPSHSKQLRNQSQKVLKFRSGFKPRLSQKVAYLFTSHTSLWSGK